MKAPSPAFSFYPKDILSDESCAAMTDEELGVYVRLLCHAWLEGSIPADHARLARMTRRSRQQFERLWEAIGPCWTAAEDDPERLVQGRLEVERAKQVSYSATQSARGKQGGRPKITPSESVKPESRGLTVALPEKTPAKPRESLPSPSPCSSTLVGRSMRPAVQSSAPANPLVQGRRPELERECLALVRRMEELTGEDPIEIIGRASGYAGAVTTKLNPATMSDDRLANTVRDLRADVAAEEQKRKAVPRGA